MDPGANMGANAIAKKKKWAYLGTLKRRVRLCAAGDPCLCFSRINGVLDAPARRIDPGAAEGKTERQHEVTVDCASEHQRRGSFRFPRVRDTLRKRTSHGSNAGSMMHGSLYPWVYTRRTEEEKGRRVHALNRCSGCKLEI